MTKELEKEPVHIENNAMNGDKNIIKLNNTDDNKLDVDSLQLNIQVLETEQNNNNNQNMLEGKHSQNFYVPNDDVEVEIELKDGNGKVVLEKSGPKCTIDRNLEEALKNESNIEFCLEDLLVSPQGKLFVEIIIISLEICNDCSICNLF